MYWIESSLADDFPNNDEYFPFGIDTVGIVDDSQGGIIAYVHKDNAHLIISALEGHA